MYSPTSSLYEDTLFVFLNNIRQLNQIKPTLLSEKQSNCHLSIFFFDQAYREVFLSGRPKPRHQGDKPNHNHFCEFPYRGFCLRPNIHFHHIKGVHKCLLQVFRKYKRRLSRAAKLCKLFLKQKIIRHDKCFYSFTLLI